MMRNFFLPGRGCGLMLLLVLLAGRGARAQAPAWAQAVSPDLVASANTTVTATASMASGDVLVVGNFIGTVSFSNTNLTSAGLTDIFVAKWSPATNSFTWAERAGGGDHDYATAVTAQGSSIYVAGAFHSDSADFGAFNVHTLLPTTRNDDLYVTKLDDAGFIGVFEWVMVAGGRGRTTATGVAVSGSNIYVTGTTACPITTFGSSRWATLGGTDSFVAKIDAAATPQWAWMSGMGGFEDDAATSVAVAGSSVYVAGGFRSQALVCNGLTVPNIPVIGNGREREAFVLKLTDNGSTATSVWGQHMGGIDWDAVTAMVVRGSAVYMAGFFQSPSATFGPLTVANVLLDGDVFVTKLLDDGPSSHFVWAQGAGTTGFDAAQALAVNGSSVYVAGSLAGPSARFGSTTLTSLGGSDVFVARLLDAGPTASFAWARNAGGTRTDIAYGLAISGTSLYVGGVMQPLAQFGSTVFSIPAGINRGFLASLIDPTLTAAAPASSVLATMQLSPNPAHARVTIQLPIAVGCATACTVLDGLGRAVRCLALPPHTTQGTLDLTNLAPGLYALRVQAGATTAIRRLVVE